MPELEGLPTADQELAAQESIFQQDGSLNEALLIERFGIGAEEAMQQVTFGNYTGTVAQMLDDKKCPVGAMVSTAYQEKGIEGVTEKFKTLGEMDPRFSVTVSEVTIKREQVKKNLDHETEVALNEHFLTEQAKAPILREQPADVIRVQQRDAAIRERQARDLLSMITTEEAPDIQVSQPQRVDIVLPEFMKISTSGIAEEVVLLPRVEQTYTHTEDTEDIPDLHTDLIAIDISAELQPVGIDTSTEIIEPVRGITTVTGVEQLDEELPERELYADSYPDELNIEGEEEVPGRAVLELETTETQEERVEIVLEALAEEFNLDLESLSPDELVEATEIIENLLTDIMTIIDDPMLEIEGYFASEEFTNVCIELLESLHIDYDEEMVHQLMLLITKEIVVGYIEDDNKLSIDILNRLGTLEYGVLDDDFQLSVVGGLTKRRLLKRHLGQLSVALQTV